MNNNKLILSQRYENKDTKEVVTVVDVRDNTVITDLHDKGISYQDFSDLYTMKPKLSA